MQHTCTNYRNNVIMTSVSGRRINEQIKTHETQRMPPDMKHIVLAITKAA